VETGEILASVQGKGESKRGGTSLLGAGGGGGAAGGAGMSMSSSNFGATIIGEATNEAVTQAADELDMKAASLPAPAAIPVDGLVADVDGNSLILNVGTSGGVSVGDVLQVARTGREIKDPATGKVLRRIETALGTVKITQADASSSQGTYSGPPGVKVGDHVKK
jgi:hypothetical protein